MVDRNESPDPGTSDASTSDPGTSDPGTSDAGTPDQGTPDYELDDQRELTTIAQVRAIADPLRESIVDLLLERAATISELAIALGRPKGTVAYHVKVLVEADILKVVRSRKIRAVTEHFYGRTARLHFVGGLKALDASGHPIFTNYLQTAAAESARAHADDTLTAILRYARVPRQHLQEFREKIRELADEFSRLPRGGDQDFGFVVGLYPTEHPHLPDAIETAGETQS